MRHISPPSGGEACGIDRADVAYADDGAARNDRRAAYARAKPALHRNITAYERVAVCIKRMLAYCRKHAVHLVLREHGSGREVCIPSEKPAVGTARRRESGALAGVQPHLLNSAQPPGSLAYPAPHTRRQKLSYPCRNARVAHRRQHRVNR